MFKIRDRRKAKTAGDKVAKAATRRRFLKGGALAAAGAGAALAFPQVSRAQTVTLKMQTSWGPKETIQDMARNYVERVEAMSGGRLKIDLLARGAVVKSFQLQEAVHKGVLNAAHTVTAYWYGKNKAATLFGTGPVFLGRKPVAFSALPGVLGTTLRSGEQDVGVNRRPADAHA